MVDPDNITDYHRSDSELQEFILFCAVVAGKSAHQQTKKLDAFLKLYPEIRGDKSPFEYVWALSEKNKLRSALEAVKMGQYNRLTTAFEMLTAINLRTCQPEDLEAVPGIGMKSSRFFIVHSREGAEYAILDTHILRYMREVLSIETPKSTPSGNKYLRLEKEYLEYAKSQNMSLADLDLQIWLSYRTPDQEAA